ncbi:hypothetical protein [Salibacter halophilus]|uniref:Uncharacterized protein n=1 Tax=Salibacter halophilus TaxID=1803916 RepID=A0A6N6M8R6_9FLAO|nr:hypothetical protein [Salibacter halophilus]KAB1065154.1 hypothetical protein F3059_04165 [Salibacter halophilus]
MMKQLFLYITILIFYLSPLDSFTQNEDKQMVSIYEYNSTWLDSIYNHLVDSLNQKFSCNKPYLLRISFFESGNDIEIILSSSNHKVLSDYRYLVKDFNLFKLNGTYVSFNKGFIEKLELFGELEFNKKMALDSLLRLNNSSSNCIEVFKEGESFYLYYSILYLSSNSNITYVNYEDFIEYGDYFHEKEKR